MVIVLSNVPLTGVSELPISIPKKAQDAINIRCYVRTTDFMFWVNSFRFPWFTGALARLVRNVLEKSLSVPP